MKSTVKSFLTILALVLGFVLGAAGAFYGRVFLNSRFLHNPVSGAGISFYLLAFAAGTVGAVAAGILIGRCFYPASSPPEDDPDQSSQS